MVGKTYLSSALFPQSINGDKGFGEGWHATNILDQNSTLVTVIVLSYDRKVADAGACAGDFAALAFDARYGVVAIPAVDEIRLVGMAVHCTAAVEDETDATARGGGCLVTIEKGLDG